MDIDLTIIVAVASNGVIGKDNSLLWHLPNDLKRFKALTSGHPIIMGRKTFESLPGILPKRPHIIITRNPTYTADKAEVVTSLDDAIALATTYHTHKAFIIGGGEIYRLAMEKATTLEITEVDAEYQGDTTFPPIDPALWKKTTCEEHPQDEKHAHTYRFVSYIRV